MEKPEAQPTKKRKINPPRRDSSSARAKKEVALNSTNNLIAPHVHPAAAHSKLQQAKNFAVAQAQKDGCKGNYKIFDSPYGNFMVPVVPTRADLSGFPLQRVEDIRGWTSYRTLNCCLNGSRILLLEVSDKVSGKDAFRVS